MTLQEIRQSLPKGMQWRISYVKDGETWQKGDFIRDEENFWSKIRDFQGNFWELFNKYKNYEVIDQINWRSQHFIVLNI